MVPADEAGAYGRTRSRSACSCGAYVLGWEDHKRNREMILWSDGTWSVQSEVIDNTKNETVYFRIVFANGESIEGWMPESNREEPIND